METAVAFLLGIIVGVGAASVWRRGDRENQSVDRKEGTKLSRELSAKKKENLAKITEYLADHKTVTNDEIERLLGVSNATAYRYLEELESERVLKQVGKTGVSVYYERVR
jgi:Fic family protein